MVDYMPDCTFFLSDVLLSGRGSDDYVHPRYRIVTELSRVGRFTMSRTRHPRASTSRVRAAARWSRKVCPKALDVGHRAFDRRSSFSAKDGNGVTQRFRVPKTDGNVTALFPRSFESADNRKAAHAVAIATKHQEPFPLFNPVKRRIAVRTRLQE